MKKIVSLLVLGSLLCVLLAPVMALAAAPTISTIISASSVTSASYTLIFEVTESDQNITSITINGAEISAGDIASGGPLPTMGTVRVAKDYTLSSGQNTFNVRATNADAEFRDKPLTVTYTPAGPGASGVAGGGAGPECCKLKKSIEVKGVTYKDTHVIAARSMTTDECPVAAADITTACPITGETTGDCHTKHWGTVCLFNTIYGVTDLLFGILLALAVLFFVYGGVTMVMASGDAEKFTKGKDYIMYALIGIFVALIAKALPSIIKTAMGM